DLRLFSWAEEEVAAARARLHVAQDEIGFAVRLLSRNGWQLTGAQTVPFSRCPLQIQLAWARIFLAQHRPDVAPNLLQSILDRVRHERPQSSALPILVLYALALSAQGASEQARALLADALPSAVAQGYLRTFVDEGAPMAALLGQVLIAGDTSGVEGVLAA